MEYSINSSLINLQNLIRTLYEYIFKNELFQKLPQNKQNKILNNKNINKLKDYINEPLSRKIKGYSIKFNEEFNKKRNFKISTSGENDILGIEELYLNIACITKVTVLSKKLICYQINKEHIEQILYSEKEVALPFLNTAINKIVVLLQRLQNIKEHYAKFFEQKYDKNFHYEEQKNLGINNNINNNINEEKQNFNGNNNSNDFSNNLKIQENENIFEMNNIDNKKDIKYNTKENKKDNDLFSNTYTNSLVFKKEDNKSPLKISLQLSNNIPKKKLLNNIKKSNINLKIVDNNKTKPRNFLDFHHGLNLKKNKKYKTTFKINSSEKNKKNLIIGDKNISFSELKNRFNDMQFLSEENIFSYIKGKI